MQTLNQTAYVLADNEAPKHLSFIQIYKMLTDQEREKVIAYAETLKGKRHSP